MSLHKLFTVGLFVIASLSAFAWAHDGDYLDYHSGDGTVDVTQSDDFVAGKSARHYTFVEKAAGKKARRYELVFKDQVPDG